MSFQEIKYKELIYMQTSMNMKVYLDIVRVIFGDQKASILEVSKVNL